MIERTFSDFGDMVKALKAAEKLGLLYDVHKSWDERQGVLGNWYMASEWLLTIHAEEIPECPDKEQAE